MVRTRSVGFRIGYTALLGVSYFGTSGTDIVHGPVVDADGIAHVARETTSGDFPTKSVQDVPLNTPAAFGSCENLELRKQRFAT